MKVNKGRHPTIAVCLVCHERFEMFIHRRTMEAAKRHARLTNHAVRVEREYWWMIEPFHGRFPTCSGNGSRAR